MAIEILNKETKEVFIIVCNSMHEVQIANVKTKEITMISTSILRKEYELK